MVRENISRRNNPEKLKLLEELISCDKKWRQMQTKLNNLRKERNELTMQIMRLKKQSKSPAKELKLADMIVKEIKHSD